MVTEHMGGSQRASWVTTPPPNKIVASPIAGPRGRDPQQAWGCGRRPMHSGAPEPSEGNGGDRGRAAWASSDQSAPLRRAGASPVLPSSRGCGQAPLQGSCEGSDRANGDQRPSPRWSQNATWRSRKISGSRGLASPPSRTLLGRVSSFFLPLRAHRRELTGPATCSHAGRTARTLKGKQMGGQSTEEGAGEAGGGRAALQGQQRDGPGAGRAEAGAALAPGFSLSRKRWRELPLALHPRPAQEHPPRPRAHTT